MPPLTFWDKFLLVLYHTLGDSSALPSNDIWPGRSYAGVILKDARAAGHLTAPQVDALQTPALLAVMALALASTVPPDLREWAGDAFERRDLEAHPSEVVSAVQTQRPRPRLTELALVLDAHRYGGRAQHALAEPIVLDAFGPRLHVFLSRCFLAPPDASLRSRAARLIREALMAFPSSPPGTDFSVYLYRHVLEDVLHDAKAFPISWPPSNTLWWTPLSRGEQAFVQHSVALPASRRVGLYLSFYAGLNGSQIAHLTKGGSFTQVAKVLRLSWQQLLPKMPVGVS
jgi:hypothetical protein